MNPESDPREPGESSIEGEQTTKKILDILESAFEGIDRAIEAEITASTADGGMRTSTVLVEAYGEGVLFVSDNESSPVMPLEIGSVRRIKLSGKKSPEKSEQP